MLTNRLTRRPCPKLLAALVLLVLGLLPATAAAAPPTWSAPVAFGEPGSSAYDVQVAVDPEGDAAAVWMQQKPGGGYGIEAAIRPAGGTWGVPTPITSPAVSGDVPVIAIDARGDAIVAWEQYVGKSMVAASTHVAGTTSWSLPATISDPARESGEAAVAIDPSGQGIVAFAGEDASGKKIVQAAFQQGRGGEWGAPLALSAPGADARDPSIGTDAAGDAFVVWRRHGTPSQVIQESQRPAGGSWTTPVTLSGPAQEANEPALAVDSSGDMAVTWTHDAGSSFAQVSTRRAGGSWSVPVSLSKEGENAYHPEIAIDANGDATAIWNRAYEGTYTVRVAAEVSGMWGAPTDVSPTLAQEPEPRLAVDADGDAAAVWWVGTTGGEEIDAAVRTGSAGGWSAPVAISTPGIAAPDADVAIDDAGRALAVWHEYGQTYQGAQSSDYVPATEAATEEGTGGGQTDPGATPDAGGQSASSGDPANSPTAPSATARCPQGKAPRKVKVAVKGKGAKAKKRIVLRCVAPTRHHKHLKHRRAKGR